MRNQWQITVLTIFVFTLLMVSCNNGTYSNPSSPPITPSEWRTATFTNVGGLYDFSDIGMIIDVPVGAVPEGEAYQFNIRLYPPNVPIIPSGPVFIRLGTFEITGGDVVFERPIDVRFRIVEYRTPGIFSRGFILDDSDFWVKCGNAVVLADGMNVIMSIDRPGIYGAFEAVPLHVEATVSQQQGPLPLSVGVKAIITGGNPPYQAVWNFGDNSDPTGGVSVAHAYVDPGDYTATVIVVDESGHWASDWIHLTAYWQSGPPAF